MEFHGEYRQRVNDMTLSNDECYTEEKEMGIKSNYGGGGRTNTVLGQFR